MEEDLVREYLSKLDINKSTGPAAMQPYLKVIEQLILETISRLTKDRKLIRSSQHGFSKGKSCLTNLITFYDEGYFANPSTGLVDEGRMVDIVYLAFSKAVDTVSHNTLVEKLMKHGLDKQAVRWTENCLNDQAQRVVISGSFQRCSVTRPEAMGLKHRRLPLDIRKHFFTVGVTEHWHRLPREVCGVSSSWIYSKPIWTWSWATTSRWST